MGGQQHTLVVLSILPLHSFQDVQLELRVFRVLLRGPYNFDCDAALLLPVPGFDNLRKSSWKSRPVSFWSITTRASNG